MAYQNRLWLQPHSWAWVQSGLFLRATFRILRILCVTSRLTHRWRRHWEGRKTARSQSNCPRKYTERLQLQIDQGLVLCRLSGFQFLEASMSWSVCASATQSAKYLLWEILPDIRWYWVWCYECMCSFGHLKRPSKKSGQLSGFKTGYCAVRPMSCMQAKWRAVLDLCYEGGLSYRDTLHMQGGAAYQRCGAT